MDFITTTPNSTFFNDDGMLFPYINISENLAETELKGYLKYRFPPLKLFIMVVLHVIVFLFGFFGNLFVITVVIRLNHMRTVTNLYICNLACADMLVLCFCLWPNLVSNMFVQWVLGDSLCKIVPYVQGVSVCASVNSLVAIAWERLSFTRWPFASRMTIMKALLIILGIWLWSFFVALPWALFFKTGAHDPKYPDLKFCMEVWPDAYKNWSMYYFVLGNFIICYLLPLSAILVCHFTIWFRVYRLPTPASGDQEGQHNEKKGVFVMCFTVVLIFGLSWLPLYIITLRMKLGSPKLSSFEQEIIYTSYPFVQLCCQLGSALNPMVYGFLNKKFRNGFKMVCKCSFGNAEQDVYVARRNRRRRRDATIIMHWLNPFRPKSTSSSASDRV